MLKLINKLALPRFSMIDVWGITAPVVLFDSIGWLGVVVLWCLFVFIQAAITSTRSYLMLHANRLASETYKCLTRMKMRAKNEQQKEQNNATSK